MVWGSALIIGRFACHTAEAAGMRCATPDGVKMEALCTGRVPHPFAVRAVPWFSAAIHGFVVARARHWFFWTRVGSGEKTPLQDAG